MNLYDMMISNAINGGGNADNQRTTLTGTMATIANDINNNLLGSMGVYAFLAMVKSQTITMWLTVDTTALGSGVGSFPLYVPVANDRLLVTSIGWSGDSLVRAIRMDFVVDDVQFVLNSMGAWDGTGTYTNMMSYASYIPYELIVDFHPMPSDD